jgi:hypothetical protein
LDRFHELVEAVRADILRAEAMKALAEINTSQSLRRALLRKTATPHHNQLLPGQNCAYWRGAEPSRKIHEEERSMGRGKVFIL